MFPPFIARVCTPVSLPPLMRLGLYSLLAILPLLAFSTPVESPIARIPLTKRKVFTDENGVIHADKLQKEVSKAIRYIVCTTE